MRSSVAAIAPARKAPVAKEVPGIKPSFQIALQRGLKRKGWSPRTLATLIRKNMGSVRGSTEEDILLMLNGDLVPEGKVWAFMKGSIIELWGTRRPRGVQESIEDGTHEEKVACEERTAHEQAELARDRLLHQQQGWSTERPHSHWGTALWIFRVAEGISTQQLAQFCDVDVRSVEGWQNGKHTPVSDTVREIHDLLPGLRAAVENGLVEKPPARDMAKPTGRPPKTATLELVPSAKVETPVAALAVVTEPVTMEPVTVAPPVTPTPAAVPARVVQTPAVAAAATAPRSALGLAKAAADELLQQAMRDHFEAMAAAVTAKAKCAAAQQRLEEARKAHEEAEFEMDLAEEKRKRACDELEKFAAAAAKG